APLDGASYHRTMKVLLHLMARYNLATDEQLFELLGNLSSEDLAKDTGGYFGSLMGLLNHILVADLGWFTAYKNSDVSLPVLESPALDYKNPGWAKPLHEDFAALRNHQIQMDQLFVSLIEQTDESVLEADITLTRSNGRQTTATF